MNHPLSRWIAGLCSVLLLAQLHGLAATPSFPERKTLHVDGYAIEYSAGDESFAQAFGARIAEVVAAPTVPSAQPPPIVAMTPAERGACLSAICHYLNLSKPTPAMSSAFDKFAAIYANVATYTKEFQKGLRRFQLWRGTELKARLEAGQVFSNVKEKPDGKGVDFTLPPASGRGDEAGKIDFSAWALPILITSRDTETGAALVAKKVQQARDIYQNLLLTGLQSTGRFNTLHETVEQGLVENYLASKDRRWFCDGVANYVAFKVYADIYGIAAAKRAYDLPAQLASYADLKGKINLAAWPAAENQSAAARASRENAANYPFAADVMFRVETGHGPDFLPKLLAEVGKTPPNQTTMKTVYRAFKRLYHEDLRSYLPST